MRRTTNHPEGERNVPDSPDRGKKVRRPYESPRLSVYTQEQILAGIGPARAIYGSPGGNP